ncbi:MAG: preprotein translocase subunit SecG [Patescibacteria group bacterium]
MLLIGQIVVSIILIILILLQEREGGLGGLLGGTGVGSQYQTRRGLEKGIYYATIVFAVVFAVLAILNIVL